MSIYEGWITTNTERTVDEVHHWLLSLDGWKGENLNVGGHRRVCRSDDNVTTCIVIDERPRYPGGTYNNYQHIGASSTIFFDVAISRKKAIGRLDDIYRIVFAFCKWDEDCNVLFTLDDGNVGVFLRRDGVCYINKKQFNAASLASYLTFPFELPDHPHNDLRKTEWPEEPPDGFPWKKTVNGTDP